MCSYRLVSLLSRLFGHFEVSNNIHNLMKEGFNQERQKVWLHYSEMNDVIKILEWIDRCWTWLDYFWSAECTDSVAYCIINTKCCASQNKQLNWWLTTWPWFCLFACLVRSMWIYRFTTVLTRCGDKYHSVSLMLYKPHSSLDDRGHLMDLFFGCLLKTTPWGLISEEGKRVR